MPQYYLFLFRYAHFTFMCGSELILIPMVVMHTHSHTHIDNKCWYEISVSLLNSLLISLSFSLHTTPCVFVVVVTAVVTVVRHTYTHTHTETHWSIKYALFFVCYCLSNNFKMGIFYFVHRLSSPTTTTLPHAARAQKS